VAGSSPLRKELEAIVACGNRQHIILIDDARALDISKRAFEEFLNHMESWNYHRECRQDIWRLTPKFLGLA
jgi:DNA-binding IclR family transcriptional regulator